MKTEKKANLLLPAASTVQISPYYKSTVTEITVDTSERSGDIFSVGKIKTGEDKKGKGIYSDVYALAKPLLMKLATAAAIQFHPEYTRVDRINANTYIGKAYGAVRLPDGTFKAHADVKQICLDDEEAKMQIDYMDKALMGIYDWRAANEAAKLFAGEWIETGKINDAGFPEKYFKVADKDRDKYIERSLLVNMTLLRKTACEKAQTGAILRVIRALLGIKGTYTLEELKQPFVVPTYVFSPDYNDPSVRNALLQQGMRAMTGLFGPAAGTFSLPEPTFADDSTTDPEDMAGQFTEMTEPEPMLGPVHETVSQPVEAPQPTAKPDVPKDTKKPVAATEEKPAEISKPTVEPTGMTAKEAKAFVVPDGHPFAGMSLKQVANQQGGMDTIRGWTEESVTEPKLAEAAAVIVAVVEENRRKAKAS